MEAMGKPWENQKKTMNSAKIRMFRKCRVIIRILSGIILEVLAILIRLWPRFFCLRSHARDVEMSPKMMQPLHGPAAIDDFSSYRFIEDLW